MLQVLQQKGCREGRRLALLHAWSGCKGCCGLDYPVL